MAYNDVTVGDALWFLSQVLLNVDWRVCIHASGRFGEPAGRVVTATITAYAAFMALVLGFLIIGLAIRATSGCLLAAFARGFSWASSMRVPLSKPPTTQLLRPPIIAQKRSVRPGVRPALMSGTLRVDVGPTG